MRRLDKMDYEALRRRTDLRLSQELTRIRNLPKRSKIKMVSTYGLKHASHTNAGLVRGLHASLSIIDREQRRVAHDMNKRQQDFAEHRRKTSVPPGPLSPLGEKEGGRSGPRQRKISERTIPDLDVVTEQNLREARKEKFLALAERSKSKTLSLIRSNSQRFIPAVPLPPIADTGEARGPAPRDPFVTQLVHRKNRADTFRKSCFPSLLGERTDNSRTLDQKEA